MRMDVIATHIHAEMGARQRVDCGYTAHGDGDATHRILDSVWRSINAHSKLQMVRGASSGAEPRQMDRGVDGSCIGSFVGVSESGDGRGGWGRVWGCEATASSQPLTRYFWLPHPRALALGQFGVGEPG